MLSYGNGLVPTTRRWAAQEALCEPAGRTCRDPTFRATVGLSRSCGAATCLHVFCSVPVISSSLLDFALESASEMVSRFCFMMGETLILLRRAVRESDEKKKM